jgi:hypothetical protein
MLRIEFGTCLQESEAYTNPVSVSYSKNLDSKRLSRTAQYDRMQGKDKTVAQAEMIADRSRNFFLKERGLSARARGFL